MNVLASRMIAPPQPGTSSWHNPIPMWITAGPSALKLRGKSICTLQACANRCDQPLADGSLIGAFGGSRLIVEAGCSRSTFWVHVRWLSQAGALVVLSRGGTIRVRTAAGVFNVANVYGIPGFRGALDARRVARAWIAYARRNNGKRQRFVIEPGAQAELWPVGIARRGGRKVSREKPDYPSPETGLPQSGNRTLPSPMLSPVYVKKTMCDGDGSFATGGGNRPRLPHFTAETLRTDDGLHALLLEAERRNVLNGSDHERLMYCTAAEQAKRIGRNPCAFFAAMVNRKAWRPTIIDEEAGTRRLRSIVHEYGD